MGIGIVGTGFLAATRARCYRRIPAAARIVAVTDVDRAAARAFAARHGVPHVAADLPALLALPAVEAVDLCVPNGVHRPAAAAAIARGKHVICTKPLTAYVGQDLPPEAPDAAVPAVDRRRMREVAVADAEAMVRSAREAGVLLLYAENWIFAPAIARARRLLAAAAGPILEMRGWESHRGSHSPYARRWRSAGGGALLRLAVHPLGAMLHLKREEGLARGGAPIRPVAVTAEVADLAAVDGVDPARAFIATGERDVENWGSVTVAFSDGARGIAIGSDNLLGGLESRLEILAADCHLKCNLSPNDLLRAYAPAPEVFGTEPILEKTDTSAGWSTPMPDEDWTSGHLAMCEELARAVREGRPATSDGELGAEVVRVVYAAYLAASEGRRVTV
ncbi:MAG: Gfo/Idh/MocA family oxidoreductase [Planctomycetota bacterium]